MAGRGADDGREQPLEVIGIAGEPDAAGAIAERIRPP
jgi:hypothetical protein